MPEAARLVWLDEADAKNPAMVGAKASRLAKARAEGLPVLDGFVVPVDISLPAVSAGEAVLRSTDNSGAARSAVFNRQPPLLLQDLALEATRRLGDTLVVRSSSRAEAESLWAGAFSSYLGMRPQDLIQGVIGCWASIFNPSTLERGRVVGTPPSDVGMAVLVQPEIRPSSGGVAALGENGTVTVISTRGHPAGLVSGRERGHVASITRDGSVKGDSSSLGARLLHRIADLTRSVAKAIRCNHIEWAADQEGNLHLLQAQCRVDPRDEGMRTQVPHQAQRGEPWMAEAVRMMIRWPGPMGEKFVWRWAIGLRDLSPASGGQLRAQVATLAEEVRTGASMLMSQRWRGESLHKVESAWTELVGGDGPPLGDLISRSPSVDRQLAAKHLRTLEFLGDALTEAEVIPHLGWMWYLDPDTLDPAPPKLPGPMRRVGTTKWDPWIYGVITALGEPVSGTPAAGGWGVGRLRFIRNAEDAARFCPREVIVASHPVGNIAPLLWNAAGLVTEEGSPGAHLFEVAGWLGVPALCGVDLRHRAVEARRRSEQKENPLVAVDGNAGRLTFLA